MKLLSALYFLFLLTYSVAQELPLSRNFTSTLMGDLYQSDSLINYSVKPLVPNFHNFEYQKTPRRPYRSYVARKIFFEPFIIIDTSDFYVTIDPLFVLEGGRDLEAIENKTLIQNTRGFQVRGSWKDKLTFSASFYENQANYPFYLEQYIDEIGVVPGQGRIKNFKDGGYDFAMASARINYIPNSHFMISLGQDKNFIGEGYRSLLLSDNAFNYPFVSVHLNFFKRKLNYFSMIAGLQDLVRVDGFAQTENIFSRKTASIHYLEYNPLPSIRVGFFESSVLVDALAKQGDGPRNTANYMFLNPIIGINSLVSGENDSLIHNTQGVNISIRPIKSVMLYGQLICREFNLKSTATQVGAAYSGIKGLLWRLEWNQSENNVVGTLAESASQTHYNQFLAHPYGQRFSEVLTLANFKVGRFVSELGGSYVVYNKDFNTFPYLINDEQVIGRGEVGYIVNPATNMQVTLGVLERFGKIRGTPSDFSANTSYIYISFQTALINRYRDF